MLGFAGPKTHVQKTPANLGHPPRFYTFEESIIVTSSLRASCQPIQINPGPPADRRVANRQARVFPTARYLRP